MKRVIVYVVSLSGLLFLLAVFILLQPHTRKPGKWFTIKHTEQITRVIFRQDSLTLTLKKENNTWNVNSIWHVRPRAIKTFMKVISGMHVKSPVSGKLLEEILSDQKAQHISVILYHRFFHFRRFEVYKTNRTPWGNIMKTPGRKGWYITYLPGEEVNPADFFVLNPYYWRDRTLFHYLPGDVIEVTLKYGDDPVKGFHVGIDTLKNRYFVEPVIPGGREGKIDTNNVKRYLTYFQELDCDEYAYALDTARKDSILRETPMYSMTLTDRFGNTFNMDTYPVREKKSKQEKPEYNPDVTYAFILPMNEMVLLKYYRIDPLIKELRYFYQVP